MKITINKRLVPEIVHAEYQRYYWDHIINRYIIYHSKNRHLYII